MSIIEEKSVARKAAFKRRKIAFETIVTDLTAVTIPHIKDADIISAYMPIRTEINPLPLMRSLHILGKSVCVPVITQEATPLTFAQWTPNTRLIDGDFGAAIPETTIPLTPDTVLAPLVAFDDIGTRLGYGGGFYDRTLEVLRTHNPTTRYYALAFSAQRSEVFLPRENTDTPLDGIFTEKGFHIFDNG